MEDLSKGHDVLIKIKSINEIMHSAMESIFRDIHLTAPQAMVVGILMRNGDLKVSDVSQKMGLSMSTVSSILDRLEKASVVERIKSEKDGRIIMIHLTDTFKNQTSEKFKQIEFEIGKRIIDATENNIDSILQSLTLLEDILKNQVAVDMNLRVNRCKNE